MFIFPLKDIEGLEEAKLTVYLGGQSLSAYCAPLSPSPSFDHVETLRDHLNSVEPSIEFTVERDTNHEITFLNVCVCRQDNGQLASKVYRKPTCTERYLAS